MPLDKVTIEKEVLEALALDEKGEGRKMKISDLKTMFQELDKGVN